MEEITIRVGKDGKINLNVAGVKGGECKNLTKAIERALGSVETTKATNEMYEQSQKIDDKQQLGGGEGKTW
jgi:hypothetical protein